MKQHKKIHLASQRGLGAEVIHLSVIFTLKQQIPKFSQDPILLYFQIFKNWWCIAADYEKNIIIKKNSIIFWWFFPAKVLKHYRKMTCVTKLPKL